MKRLLGIIVLSICGIIQIFAEPGNNLNKSLTQIQRDFPDCIFWCESRRGKYYKSDGDGLPIMFEINLLLSNRDGANMEQVGKRKIAKVFVYKALAITMM